MFKLFILNPASHRIIKAKPTFTDERTYHNKLINKYIRLPRIWISFWQHGIKGIGKSSILCTRKTHWLWRKRKKLFQIIYTIIVLKYVLIELLKAWFCLSDDSGKKTKPDNLELHLVFVKALAFTMTSCHYCQSVLSKPNENILFLLFISKQQYIHKSTCLYELNMSLLSAN